MLFSPGAVLLFVVCVGLRSVGLVDKTASAKSLLNQVQKRLQQNQLFNQVTKASAKSTVQSNKKRLQPSRKGSLLFGAVKIRNLHSLVMNLERQICAGSPQKEPQERQRPKRPKRPRPVYLYDLYDLLRYSRFMI